MTSTAAQFARQLTAAFRGLSASALFSEVQQFRALMSAFSTLTPQFLVEEYHGPKHQVFFNGAGAWGRTPARCELCDVVIVAFSPPPDLEIRVTFLQAKLSKEKHLSLCRNYPLKNDAVVFKANLEQWDLLSRRPSILPVPPFKIHAQLLQSAILASVGSFGVFHKRGGKYAEFFYSSADCLTVVGSPKQKQGRLKTDGVSLIHRHVSGHRECTFCCCMPTFGRALYNLEIGTPVVLTAAKVPDKQSPLEVWLRALLHEYIRQVNRESPLAHQLLSYFSSSDEMPSEEPMALPAIVLLRGSRTDGYDVASFE